jgi:serine/threonine protein kinase
MAVRITPAPSDLIGEGGEACIYKVGGNKALKLFKSPSATRDAKLRTLPSFPPHVVAPLDLETGSNGSVLGYTMPIIENAYHLKSLASREFRTKSGIDGKRVTAIFQQLHDAVTQLHAAGIVIGDFNPLNVLIDANGDLRLLDSDSMQFNGFLCEAYTPRYADPLLFRADTTPPSMVTPHSERSDWYSFALMLFESLFFVHPYGGVLKPTGGSNVPLDMRPFKRISIFHPNVAYPAAAIPLAEIPKAFQEFYFELLVKDARGIFPIALLSEPRAVTVPAPINRVKTSGTILCTQLQRGRSLCVFHEDGKFMREDRSVVMSGELDPHLHFVIDGNATIVSKLGQTFRISRNGETERLSVERYRDREPVIGSSGDYLYWVNSGELYCRASDGKAIHIDSVIAKQTRIWVGTTFGVGLSHAGGIVRAFIFEGPAPRRIVDLPTIPGYIKEAECIFPSASVAELSIKSEHDGKVHGFCLSLDHNGHLLSRGTIS